MLKYFQVLGAQFYHKISFYKRTTLCNIQLNNIRSKSKCCQTQTMLLWSSVQNRTRTWSLSIKHCQVLNILIYVKASGNANHFRINQLFHSKRRRSIKEILNSSYFKKVKSKQEQHIHTFSIFIEFTINSDQDNYCN